MSALVIRDISASSAEKIFRSANQAAQRMPYPATGWADKGLRVARDRHPILLRGLEAMAEVMDKINEAQHGQTRRNASTSFAEKFDAPQVKAVKEAYRTLDEGQPADAYGYLYAAMAEYQGIISGWR